MLCRPFYQPNVKELVIDGWQFENIGPISVQFSQGGQLLYEVAAQFISAPRISCPLPALGNLTESVLVTVTITLDSVPHVKRSKAGLHLHPAPTTLSGDCESVLCGDHGTHPNTLPVCLDLLLHSGA